MNSEGLPFSVTEGSLRRLGTSGINSEVYEFCCNGRWLVIKEAKRGAQIYQAVGDNPDKAAGQLKRLYELAKKHFGERLAETMFIVVKNRKGVATVVSIQAKVEGRALVDVIKEGDGEVALAMCAVVEEFGALWEKITQDRNWKKLPKKVRTLYRKDDMHDENIFLTTNGKYIVVDF